MDKPLDRRFVLYSIVVGIVVFVLLAGEADIAPWLALLLSVVFGLVGGLFAFEFTADLGKWFKSG